MNDDIEMGEEEPVAVREGLWTFEEDDGGVLVLDTPQLATWWDYR